MTNYEILHTLQKKGLRQHSINNGYRRFSLLKGISGKNIIIVNTIYNDYLEKKTLLKYSFRNCPRIGKYLATVT
jgi:hypothetical protein